MRKSLGDLFPVPYGDIAREATPVALSYIPIAILFGTMAEQAGLTFAQTAAFSLFVYSGAAQLIAVQMLVAGASHLAVILAAGVLTVRHVLMGASLSLYTKGLPKRAKALLSPFMTDESFALAWKAYRTTEASQGTAHGFFLGTNLYLYMAWNAATIAGYAAGQFISVPARPFELLFALLFIAILAGLITTAREGIVAVASLVFAALLLTLVPVAWLIPLAGFAACAVGVALERRGRGSE